MYILKENFSQPSDRIITLKNQMRDAAPCVEASRALLLTESYKETEHKPTILRRAKAFEKILGEIPIIIRDEELVVGSQTLEPKSSQIFPEFSHKWISDEFETIGKRNGDAFLISEDVKEQLQDVFDYWEGKTTSELATSYMTKENIEALEENVYTVGNYHLNGVGHVSVDYAKILKKGYRGVIEEVENAMASADKTAPDYLKKRPFWESILISCHAVIKYANRYADLATEMAGKEKNTRRKEELFSIAQNCKKVPEYGASNFYEACQSFWFIHMVISIESNGHSISPARFDQYMYPYYEIDTKSKDFDINKAQELIDCIWVKFNDLNKVRDAISTRAFGGYPLFQNLIVGGQTKDGKDATNDLTYMCIDASAHVRLSAPSFSVRIWNKTPDELLLRSCELSRLGTGMPSYYNDEVIIPSLVNNGLTLKDAREYAIIGCVEPQAPGKTEGWHDSAFFNLARLLQIVVDNGMSNGKQIGPETGEFTDFSSMDEIIDAYRKQMEYFVYQLVSTDNVIDLAHAERAPLPFLSCMVDDCISTGKSLQEGGAHYNFSGPQGVGVANVGDAFGAIKYLVFDTEKLTLKDLKEALATNFGEDATNEEDKRKHQEIRLLIKNKAPKFGNDIDDVDELARLGALIYCEEVEKYTNPRGGDFHPGLYPAAINVLFGDLIGPSLDGRKAREPLADGVSPCTGADTNGPTSAVNSVAKLDHHIASNGTLLNQKFYPGSIKGTKGLQNLGSLLRSYFDQKGLHIQFNVVDRETLIAAQENPNEYRDLVIRVAGYSAQFIVLDKRIQDEIIRRTEQKF